MTLGDLKVRAFLIALLAAGLFLPAALTTAAPVLVPTISVIGGLAVIVWLAAIVADATVRSLKKEN